MELDESDTLRDQERTIDELKMQVSEKDAEIIRLNLTIGDVKQHHSRMNSASRLNRTPTHRA